MRTVAFGVFLLLTTLSHAFVVVQPCRRTHLIHRYVRSRMFSEAQTAPVAETSLTSPPTTTVLMRDVQIQMSVTSPCATSQRR